jgi:Fic family protein
MTMPDYKWRPIDDLPENWSSISSQRLESLHEIWNEQKGKLNAAVIRDFNEKLHRQWAVETGIIENIYTLDRGTTQLLIEHGINSELMPRGVLKDQSADYVINLINDQKHVIEGLFDFVSSRRTLSTSYIKEIHAGLTCHQRIVEARDQFGNMLEIELLRGEWKREPNSPLRPDGGIHEYCPPEHVASEMDRLIEMHLQHAEMNAPPDIEAAWLHHRFTQIHPFQDGNGRVARALATLVFLRAGWFSPVVTNDKRVDYIGALESADSGALEKLVLFFGRLAESTFLQALRVCDQIVVEKGDYAAAVQAVAETFKVRKQPDGQKKVLETADLIFNQTKERLDQLRADLLRVIPNNAAIVEFDCCHRKSRWFWGQTIDIAERLGYHANLRMYYKWAGLTLKNASPADSETRIVISFYPVGVRFDGLACVSAFIFEKNPAGITAPRPLSDDIFVFTYKDSFESLSEKFEKWISEVIISGLNEWRGRI